MSDLVGNPEDRFSHVAAHIDLTHSAFSSLLSGIFASLCTWFPLLKVCVQCLYLYVPLGGEESQGSRD